MATTSYIQQIATYFKNLTLNSIGVERDLYRLIQDKDISAAISLMQDRDADVDEAIREYNPQTHRVMHRPNKPRKNDAPYISEKLPRSRQRYINEVELFFLLANPIAWKKDEGADEAFTLFTDFLKANRFDASMRKIKRLTGAETESAKLYRVFRDDKTNEMKVRTVVLARSEGYRLRPLFDQYGALTAFAYGYALKETTRTVYHWDIQTADFLFFCKQTALGWEVETYPNPTGRINVVYYRQKKAWEGVEPRIEREEMLDSKMGDANNYFSDPIATATADVVDNLMDPSMPGKLIQLTGQNSRFEYVNPPQASQSRDAEKADLHDSILFDTFTPDFSFEKLKGMGSLSGVAIKNAMILGYVKRDNLKETYEELIDREKNIIIGILSLLHPDKARELSELRVSFSFAEPFTVDKQETWGAIAQLYSGGLCSLEQAVSMLSLTDAPEEEISRIRKAEQDKAVAQSPPADGADGDEPARATVKGFQPGASASPDDDKE